FFFFSSRRRHTRFSRDWSSDVCSSDLGRGCSLDLFDRVARTLVTGADNERERSRNGFSRRLDYLNVFSLIEIDALAGRAEHDVALHASGLPLCQFATAHFRVKVLVARERSSDW